jgi:hypothetical protein
MKNPLLYFSTNTKLAYFIASNFYNQTYYVWCSPVFDPTVLDDLNLRKSIPPSSSPYNIYKSLRNSIDGADKHSPFIEQNKQGLKKGALVKYNNGDITEDELITINKIIDTADLGYFSPLLFIIPSQMVCSKIKEVSVDDRVSILSEEYLIEDLKKIEFDIIKF